MSKSDKKDKKRSHHSSDDDGSEKESRHKRKAEKQAKKVAKMLGYTNDTNPFGDSNLLKPFVWGKKIDKEKVTGKKSGSDNKYSSNNEDDKRLELLEEINRVRKRREDREKELEEMERLRNEEQRLREVVMYGDWKEKEEEFHTDQTRMRSIIRIKERRENMFDKLVKNIYLVEDIRGFDVEYHIYSIRNSTNNNDDENQYSSSSHKASSSINPNKKLKGKGKHGSSQVALDILRTPPEMVNLIDLMEQLPISQIESILPDLEANIQYYNKLKKESVVSEITIEFNETTFLSYLEDLKIILLSLKKRLKQKSSGATVHRSVAKDVEKMLENKTYNELELLQVDIYKRLQQSTSSDKTYWEEVLFEIKYHRCCKNIRSLHDKMIKHIVSHVKKFKHQINTWSCQSDGIVENKLMTSSSSSSNSIDIDNKGEDINEDNLDILYDISNPVPAIEGENDDVDIDQGVISNTTRNIRDPIALIAQQQKQASTSSTSANKDESTDDDHEEKMEKSDEIQLPSQHYNWSDKYRPRKPRYFNRVRTGWDWNKYNKTHYDHDNPPPKTIQGYKFAIFYPDLIDVTNTPKYFLESTGDGNRDFAIIRFHSGPPYEDIAFKIVNKEWDKDRRSGFRCQFEKGVLTLNFNFKRIFYRR